MVSAGVRKLKVSRTILRPTQRHLQRFPGDLPQGIKRPYSEFYFNYCNGFRLYFGPRALLLCIKMTSKTPYQILPDLEAMSSPLCYKPPVRLVIVYVVLGAAATYRC